MKHTNFDTLMRHAVGFDPTAQMLRGLEQRSRQVPNYPPYDIEKVSENEYRVTVAVAGFKPDELSVTTQDGVLTITGQKPETDEERNYLHRGIAQREFERTFHLETHVFVTGASAKDGLLQVILEREVPEAQKPRTVEINAG